MIGRIPIDGTDLIKAQSDLLAAEVERWLWKALAQGVGNSVWRSDPELQSGAVIYQFAILKPGDPPPGTGIIYGPMSGAG